MNPVMTPEEMGLLARRGEKISYETFLALADEDTRAEWVDGDVIFMSPASNRHQEVSLFLIMLFGRYLERQRIGRVFYESFQMKAGPDLPGREPDIIFVATDHLHRVKDNYLDGPGDLVVEVVSLDSRKRDREQKFQEYQQGGVLEYWLIDPLNERADFYGLGTSPQSETSPQPSPWKGEGVYAAVPLDAQGYYASAQLPGLRIDPQWLWQDPMPEIPGILAAARIGGG